MGGSDMSENAVLLTTLILGLIAVSPEEAQVTGIRICQLMPNTEVRVKLSDDTLVRRALTDMNGNIFIKNLHGKSWVIESTSVGRKQFRFEAKELEKVKINPKSGILSVGCVKLF